MAVARVHKHLIIKSPVSGWLAYSSFNAYGYILAMNPDVTINVHGVETIVPTTKLQPIGLILNELVTNAAKHGSGEIEVEFSPASDGKFC